MLETSENMKDQDQKLQEPKMNSKSQNIKEDQSEDKLNDNLYHNELIADENGQNNFKDMKVDLVNMDDDEFDDSDFNQIIDIQKDNKSNNDEGSATIEQDNLLASTS